MKKPSIPGKFVSLTVFADPDCPCADFDEFENTAAREDTFAICGLPVYLRRGLDSFRTQRERKRSLEDASAFCVETGLPFVDEFGGRRAIAAAKESLLHCGSDDVAILENWAYEFNTHQAGRIPRLWTRLHPDVVKQCWRITAEVGLRNVGVVCGLAIFSTLIHATHLPDEVKAHMRDELVTFGKKLKARAETAARLAESARPASSRLRLKFDDVLAAVDPDGHNSELA